MLYTAFVYDLKLLKKLSNEEKGRNRQDNTKVTFSLKPTKLIDNFNLDLDKKEFQTKKSLKSLTKSNSSSSLEMEIKQMQTLKPRIKKIMLIILIFHKK